MPCIQGGNPIRAGVAPVNGFALILRCICEGGTLVANALFHLYVGVGDYTLPLDHSVLVRSNICHLGYHGDTWDYVWCT